MSEICIIKLALLDYLLIFLVQAFFGNFWFCNSIEIGVF